MNRQVTIKLLNNALLLLGGLWLCREVVQEAHPHRKPTLREMERPSHYGRAANTGKREVLCSGQLHTHIGGARRVRMQLI
jgi:hypothetical protein